MFQRLLSIPENATSFLQAILPSDIATKIDWHAPIAHKSSQFISDKLKPSEADLLFQVSTNDGQNLLLYILVEHQSSQLHMMGLKMFRYMGDIWNAELKEV